MGSMKKFLVALAVAGVLAGCSSEEAPPRPPVEAEDGYPEGGQDALDAETEANAGEDVNIYEAGEVAEWDNGLTAQIVEVTAEESDHYQYTEKGHDTVLMVTVEIANVGESTFVFESGMSGGPSDYLYYGENLYSAQGWAVVDGSGMTDLPKQLVPGSSTTYTGQWTLPAEEMGVLTFEFTPDSEDLPPYYFTGVEALIA